LDEGFEVYGAMCEKFFSEAMEENGVGFDV
jgi:hypothetical protein